MGLTNNLGKLSNMITSTGSAVGIAQPSPAYTLDVNGTGRYVGALTGLSAVFSSTVQASAYRLTGMTAGSGALYWTSDRVTLANYNATGVVNIEANGGTSVATFGGATYNNDFVGTLRNTTSAYFATTSGNVGIGNVSASYKLDVTGTGRFTTSLLVNDISISSSTMQASGNYYIGCNNANFIQFYTSNTDRMAITAAGNVGIGTTAPNYSLHINTATTITRLQITNTTTGTTNASGLQIIQDGNNTTLSLKPSGFMSFETANTERMRITSGGNVGIGNAGTSTVKLYTKSDTATSSSYAFGCENGSVNLLLVRGDGLFQTGTAANSPYNASISGRSAIIDSSGTLGYLVSTRESKANIESIKSIDFINQLNPVSFNYRKKDNEMNYTDEVYDNITYGFIADEVEEVNKELVMYNEDGTLAGVEYNSMIAILTKAVQEQQIQIQNLQEQINILQNK